MISLVNIITLDCNKITSIRSTILHGKKGKLFQKNSHLCNVSHTLNRSILTLTTHLSFLFYIVDSSQSTQNKLSQNLGSDFTERGERGKARTQTCTNSCQCQIFFPLLITFYRINTHKSQDNSKHNTWYMALCDSWCGRENVKHTTHGESGTPRNEMENKRKRKLSF